MMLSEVRTVKHKVLTVIFEVGPQAAIVNTRNYETVQ